MISFAIFFLIFIHVHCGKISHQDFKKDLLKNYDVSTRPVREAQKAIDVSIQIALRQIVDLDEKNQILVAAMLLRLIWKDEQLVWQDSMKNSSFNYPERIILPYERVWTPDLYIYNNVASSKQNHGFLSVNGSRVLLYNNGIIHWNLPMTIQSSCSVDVLYFPFDHQVCEIQFASWTYDESQLKLKVLDPNSTSRLTSLNENVELTVRGLKVIQKVINGSSGYRFPQVILRIHIQRRALFYGYTVIAPSILLCVFTVFSFWLPSGNAQKIDMGLTVFLFLYFLQLMIAENTPESNSTPLIGTFLTMVMTLNSISLVFATIVLYLKRRGSTEPCPSPPKFLLSFAKRILGPMTLLEYNSVTEHFYTQMLNAIRACEIIDKPNYEHSDSRRQSEDVKQNTASNTPVKNPLKVTQANYALIKEQYKIRSFEWVYIAQVVDRTLFLIYLIATILSIFVLLVYLPSINTVKV